LHERGSSVPILCIDIKVTKDKGKSAAEMTDWNGSYLRYNTDGGKVLVRNTLNHNHFCLMITNQIPFWIKMESFKGLLCA